MPHPRFLEDFITSSPPQKISTLSISSNLIVILAALLCAVTCIVGLVAMAQCPFIRHLSGRDDDGGSNSPGNKGLKKNILKGLPKITYHDCDQNKYTSDCASCLAEFVDGDEIRLLTDCGHVFHVGCIDKWFKSHSSCPTCRRILGVELPVAMPSSLDVRVEAPVVNAAS